MASVDSGVETGNESNDGSLDAKNDNPIEQVQLKPFECEPIQIEPIQHRPLECEPIQLEQISTVGVSKVYPLLPESSSIKNAMKMTGCIFGSDLPHFKLPRCSLPPGFGEIYPTPKADDRSARFPLEDGSRTSRRRCHSKPGVFGICSTQGIGRLAVLHVKEDKMLRKRNDWKDWQWTDSLVERKLRIAVSTNNIELVQSYLFSRVNPNCVDSMGRSPLHLASCSGYSDIVRLLLENGANPNQRDRLGNTPLHLAACTNNIVVVTLLLKAGTDVCSSDLHGRSPLQLAQSKLKLLQKHMGSGGIEGNFGRNQAYQVSLPAKQNLETIDEIRVYDNAYVSNQALQIVEMMRLFLQKRGQEAEAELLSAFSSRLTLSETKEQVETQVRDLLDSLSGLSLESSSGNQNSSNSSSGFDSAMTDTNSVTLYSNARATPSSIPSCSFVPSSSSSSVSHYLPSTFQNSQLQ